MICGGTGEFGSNSWEFKDTYKQNGIQIRLKKLCSWLRGVFMDHLWSVFLYITIPIEVDPDFRIGTVSTGNGMTGVEIS